jgi:TonB-dependent starch-binding outer membrane protein SusC
MKTFLSTLLILYASVNVLAQSKIEGRVVSSVDNTPLPGVNVLVKGSTIGTTTDANGLFAIQASEKDILVFSFIGYAGQEVVVGTQTLINLSLNEDISTLDEVTIVSTGYQKLPKERATGSFVQLDNALVNRRVSTDILSRLEDVTSGLIFNRNIEGNTNDISIRGRSTINGNASPLIVIDNFPYDGDINNINPNDVESITVLKDAAAASIWGARAGNGVIVITTKKGKANEPLQISANANITIGKQPDLFYTSRMSTSDFIDVEKTLFDKGYYESIEASGNHAPLTPGVELMIANRDGNLSDVQLESELALLRKQDVRNDYQKYLYRNSTNQQYAINLRGGSTINQYFISAGLDKDLDNMVGNDFTRVTLNAGNTWRLLKDKVEFSASMYYAQTSRTTNNDGIPEINFASGPMYPYASLKDNQGNSIPLTKDYRLDFLEDAQNAGLLNWQYNPLDEINANDNTVDVKDYRINTKLQYAITKHLNAELSYQYWNGNTFGRNHRSIETYYTRNLINVFTQDYGDLYKMIPDGGILDRFDQQSYSHNVRAQVNYSNSWNQHELSALGGYEVKEINTDKNSFRYYGYDDALATNQIVDYVNYFPAYNDPGNYLSIPNADAISSLTDRYISYFGNAAYSYKKRYTVSGSVRKDQSNLFGVKANQRGVPLWSAGLGWILSEEEFLNIPFVPYLKLRTTFGYNGNIDKSVTAYTTALSRGANRLTGLPYATILNPPNPELQWERVKLWNTGIDFESKNRILSGSIEYYSKWGIDLIGTSPFPPSTGVASFRGNNASTKGHGIDLVLNSLNINGDFKWSTNFLFSYLTEKVTTYKIKAPVYSYVTGGGGSVISNYPLEGKPLYAIYSFDWAGLDPETGDPRGYIDGQPSSDYSLILTSATTESIRYHGPARPTTFGSLRNTFSWRNFSLSVNVSYRLGYFFKMNSVKYATVLNGYVAHGDFANRWREPGDENHTHVPSMPENINLNRDDFYLNSSVLVEKGDHIRLQDVNLSYTFDRNLFAKLPMKNVQFYLYANNLGVIWKATDKDIDPDFPTQKPVRTIAAGLRIDF